MKKIINFILIFCLLLTCVAPITTQAAPKTLKDYKNELAALKNKQQENNRLTNAAIAEINSKRNAIIQANNDIEANEGKVEEAKEKVEQSKKDIEIKTQELYDLFTYTQSVDTEQVYLQFVMEADSIADFIERSAIIDQLANYQEEELSRLENLIKINESLQVTLEEENVALENSITQYEKKITELEAYMNSLASVGLDYKQQIKAQEELIAIYEKAGCTDNDSVDVCYYSKLYNAKNFIKPLSSAVVTQAYSASHNGIDLSGSGISGQPIYAPAAGVVASATYKNKCGGNIVHIHHYINGVAYTTTYGHMKEIYVKPGQTVDATTVIGTVGGGRDTWSYDSCTTGAHLHYTVAKGHYLSNGTDGYTSWSTFSKNWYPSGNEELTGIKNYRGYRWTRRY
ncbi:MAG: murein hydrolase activator EnvC family protein [Bacilli bacterium]